MKWLKILSKSAGSYIFNVNKESDKKSRASDKRFTQSDALLYCLKTHLFYFKPPVVNIYIKIYIHYAWCVLVNVTRIQKKLSFGPDRRPVPVIKLRLWSHRTLPRFFDFSFLDLVLCSHRTVPLFIIFCYQVLLKSF